MAESAPVSIAMDLSQHKTTVPVIADNRFGRFRIANVGEATNEKGKMIKFEYHALEALPTTDGGAVNPGFPVFENITLYSKDTPPGQWPDFAKTKICKRIDAALGTGDPGNKAGKPVRPNFGPILIPDLIGKEVILQLTAKTGEYEGNDVKKIMHVSEMPAA